MRLTSSEGAGPGYFKTQCILQARRKHGVCTESLVNRAARRHINPAITSTHDPNMTRAIGLIELSVKPR